ncbi:STAS domain-containing protein [Thalassotalea piscium]|uniref:Phospholipid transport system transporter-binding protein n=1 Tax=Thalassotalea piscium TaxID=1230533 RepID=A0A7X0NHT3_9GAMM|nr:STAS domain-containing protein [Thalassotalea piscium]MBB6543730.1 phospholipid transport system transporter-binding protein [Thalassotalea piscium]
MTVKITMNDDGIALAGELTQATITQALEKQSVRFFEQKNVTIDLAGIVKVDTAGLAWLLTLVELASSQSSKVCFTHLSTELQNLVKLSAVDSFLPSH